MFHIIQLKYDASPQNDERQSIFDKIVCESELCNTIQLKYDAFPQNDEGQRISHKIVCESELCQNLRIRNWLLLRLVVPSYKCLMSDLWNSCKLS